MASVKLADGELYYQLDGRQGQPVLVLSNSLGTNLHMWDAQVPGLAEHFQVLRYDTRGHGNSLVAPGPYRLEQLGHDVLALLDALGLSKVHFCGLSMGGQIGQWLGINAPERIAKLVLCNTGAKIGSEQVWNPRIETVLREGEAAMVGLGEASIARWFTPGFAQANPAAAKRITDMLAATSPEGYAASCAAVRDADLREQLGQIRAPLLVVSGTQDPVTTPVDGDFISTRVAGARHIQFDAAHLSNVEVGEAFTQAIIDFLKEA